MREVAFSWAITFTKLTFGQFFADFLRQTGRVIVLFIILIILVFGWVAEARTHLHGRRHFHTTIINPFSQDVGECGIIPKIKLRNRSRDAGISSPGQIPWQVGIFHKPGKAFLGSGTMISSDLILTSPVVLLTVQDYIDLEIRLGDWDISSIDSPQESYDHFSASITEVIFYPDYNINLGIYPTVLLMRLQDPVDFHSYPQIGPICLPPIISSLPTDIIDHCFVSGWGSQNRNYSYNEDELDKFTSSIRDQLDPQSFEDYTLNENIENIRKPTRSDSQVDKDNIIPSGYSVEEKTNNFPENRTEQLNTVSMTGNSATQEINAASRNNLVFKLPDPVEDYLDEISGYVNDDISTESENFSNLFDEGDETRTTDDFDPIMEHHERNLNRHKLKYNKGKQYLRKLNRAKENANNNDVIHPQIITQYFDNNHKKRSSGKHRKKVLYQSHAESSKITLLKLFQVQIHQNCRPTKSNNAYHQTHTNHCISPANGHYTMFPCMIDLGSPVFCTSNSGSEFSSRFSRTVSTRRVYSKSPKQESPKAYLMGLVGSWTPSCSDTGYLVGGSHSSSVAVSPFSMDIIQFIYKNI